MSGDKKVIVDGGRIGIHAGHEQGQVVVRYPNTSIGEHASDICQLVEPSLVEPYDGREMTNECVVCDELFDMAHDQASLVRCPSCVATALENGSFE